MIAHDRTRLTDLSHILQKIEHYIKSTAGECFLYNVLFFMFIYAKFVI